MSLYGALFTGVSALTANGQAIGVSSNNIANVNTVGYKASEAQFETLLSADTPAGDFSTGGVRLDTRQLVSGQGLAQATTSNTDLAISGQGFFAVAQDSANKTGDGQLLYTRAGSFTPDVNGNLQNTQGYYLMGWPLDSAGNVSSNLANLSAINTDNLTGDATQTSNVSLNVNLRASTAATTTGYAVGDMSKAPNAAGYNAPDYQTTINVYDSQGTLQPVRLAFIKTGANQWNYEAIYDGSASNLDPTLETDNVVASGQLSFDSGGNLASSLHYDKDGLNPASDGTAGLAQFSIPWGGTSGLSTQSLSLNFGSALTQTGSTQLDAASGITSKSLDGSAFGKLAKVEIGDDGIVTAHFDNGSQRPIYKIPLATFVNPDGLTALNANVYQASQKSGPVTLAAAQSGSAGKIEASNLEASTVDLAKEFTDMITTQRAYSAATRIVTTADSMLQEMLQIKR